jgi:hypothetical protein
VWLMLVPSRAWGQKKWCHASSKVCELNMQMGPMKSFQEWSTIIAAAPDVVHAVNEAVKPCALDSCALLRSAQVMALTDTYYCTYLTHCFAVHDAGTQMRGALCTGGPNTAIGSPGDAASICNHSVCMLAPYFRVVLVV